VNTTSPYRWVILGVAWLIACICALTTFVCAPHLEAMIATFHISIAEASLFMSLINLSTFSFNLVGGLLLRQAQARTLIGVALAVVTTSQLISGLTDSYLIEMTARCVLGMGIGVTMICVLQSLSEWFPVRELSTAFSIQVTGWATGNVIGLAAPIPLSQALGTSWRGSFLVFGALTFVTYLVFWLLFRESTTAQTQTSRGMDGITVGAILKMKEFWILSVGLLGQISGMSIAMTWLPTSLMEAGWAPASAALLTTIFPLMGIPANLVGGVCANKLKRRKPLFVGSGVGLMLSYVIFAVAAQGTLVWVAMIVGGWFNFFFIGPILAIPSELPEVGARGTGLFLGVQNLIVGVGGFLAPLAAGVMRETTGSFGAGFGFAACLSALILIPGFLARERDNRRETQV
jgi:predicted MFS family arabinose efflux permease